MYPIYFFIFAILLGVGQFFFFGTSLSNAFLLGMLISNVGLQGIYAFIGHYFMSDEVAEGIGWPKGSPFQKEIAFTNLSYGVLGILCIWIHGDFWLAVLIGHAIFLWGAGFIHFMDLKKEKNISPFNAGPILYFDILIPILMLGLYIIGLEC